MTRPTKVAHNVLNSRIHGVDSRVGTFVMSSSRDCKTACLCWSLAYKTEEAKNVSVWNILLALGRHPYRLIVMRWNWKSAVCSSVVRGAIFFGVNLAAGWRAAIGAMCAEFLFRTLSSGFYGALTQAFRCAEPAWLGAVTAMIVLPLASHSMEFAVHYLRGTPKLTASIVTSVCFTSISTLFNLYAMRHGALIVGSQAASLWTDLRRMPAIVCGFVAAGPLWLIRRFNKPFRSTCNERA
jgi:hypothetical protein